MQVHPAAAAGPAPVRVPKAWNPASFGSGTARVSASRRCTACVSNLAGVTVLDTDARVLPRLPGERVDPRLRGPGAGLVASDRKERALRPGSQHRAPRPHDASDPSAGTRFTDASRSSAAKLRRRRGRGTEPSQTITRRSNRDLGVVRRVRTPPRCAERGLMRPAPARPRHSAEMAPQWRWRTDLNKP